jgi:hypothetical protein
MGLAPNSRLRRLAGASVRFRLAGCGDSLAPADSNRRSPPLGLHRPGTAGPIAPGSRLPGRYRFALGKTPRAPRRLRLLVRPVGQSSTPAIFQRMRGRIGVTFRSLQSSSLKSIGAQRLALQWLAGAEQNRTKSTAWPSATRKSASFRCDATATPSRVQRPAPRRRRSVWACAGPLHDRPPEVMSRVAAAQQSAGATRFHPHRRAGRQEISRQERNNKAATTVKGLQFGLGKTYRFAFRDARFVAAYAAFAAAVSAPPSNRSASHNNTGLAM